MAGRGAAPWLAIMERLRGPARLPCLAPGDPWRRGTSGAIALAVRYGYTHAGRPMVRAALSVFLSDMG